MRPSKHAKVVATLGPASDDLQTNTGAVQCRCRRVPLELQPRQARGSSAPPGDHSRGGAPRRTSHRCAARPAGPEAAHRHLPGRPDSLIEGEAFRLDLDTKTPGSTSRVLLPHPEIFTVLEPGAELLLDDGRVRLRVERCGRDFAETCVVNGATVGPQGRERAQRSAAAVGLD